MPHAENRDFDSQAPIASIQSHAFLFALSEPDLLVRQLSANICELIGKSPEELLGRSLEALLGVSRYAAFQAQLAEVQLPLYLPSGATGLPLDGVAYRGDGALIVEFEPLEGALAAEAADSGAHTQTLARLAAAPGISQLMQQVVTEVQKLTGFEHVMLYQLDQEGAGEVIAEVITADWQLRLGSTFPANEIMSKARASFLLKPLEFIADVSSKPAQIIPPLSPMSGRALDLTNSALRSASPLQIEYLSRQGIRSSLSIAIIVEQRLWGIIACYAARPLRVNHLTRSVCALIAQSLAPTILLHTAVATHQHVTVSAAASLEAEPLSELVLARRPVFLKNRWLDLEKMRTALVTRDFDLLRKIAHNCKGIGNGYGFPKISELGAAVSKAAKATDEAALQQVLSDFEQCLLDAAAESTTSPRA